MLSPIDEIKNRLDIVEVIKGYIKLNKAGANYRAVCPFHSEKKPSFFVSPARQIWHCFGCSKGGNVFQFVMDIEGIEFGDALRILAHKAGVELKKQDPQIRTERQKLYEICELAARFFEKQLESSKTGQEAEKYLLARGVKKESLEKWRVGYAPDIWQSLFDFLISKGYRGEEIEKAGLALRNEQGSFYDRFRGRIIFPIFDLNSQVVGFGGRIFGEKREEKEIAKYVNSPQTLLYDKSRILYGLDKAKVEIRKRNSCILVEGYIDLIMVSQSGFENVVATSGTALTPFQLKILKRYSDNLLTAFDMDVAGDSATKRGIDLAQGQDFNVKVITLPQESDPADFIFKDVKNWEVRVENAKSILDFYFESVFSKFNKDNPEEKGEISNILLPVIKRIPNRIVRSHWVGELAKRLGAKEEDVEEELKKVKLEGPLEQFNSISGEATNLPKKSRRELLEERLAVLVLKYPQNLELIEEKQMAGLSQPIREIFDCLKKNPKLEQKKITPQLSDFLNYLYLGAEIEELEEKALIPEIKNCLKEIKQIEVKNRLDEIAKAIKEAEVGENSQKIEKLIQKFNSYSKSRSDLE